MLASTLMLLKFAGLIDFLFFTIVKESPNLTLGVIILMKFNINLRKKKRPACEKQHYATYRQTHKLVTRFTGKFHFVSSDLK